MKKIIFLILAVFAFLPQLRAQKLSFPLKKAIRLTETEAQKVTSEGGAVAYVCRNDSGRILLIITNGHLESIKTEDHAGSLSAYTDYIDGKVTLQRSIGLKILLEQARHLSIDPSTEFVLKTRKKRFYREIDKMIFLRTKKILEEQKRKK